MTLSFLKGKLQHPPSPSRVYEPRWRVALDDEDACCFTLPLKN